MKNEQQTINIYDVNGTPFVNATYIYQSMNYKTVGLNDFLGKFISPVLNGEMMSIQYEEVMHFLKDTMNNPMLSKSKPEAAKIHQLLEEEFVLFEKLQGSSSGGFINWIKSFF